MNTTTQDTLHKVTVLLEDGSIHTLKHNDYFRWRYKYTHGKFDPYHCKSCLCKVNSKGEMKDLFWSQGDSYDSCTLNPNEVDLIFLGNLDDYTEIRECMMKYYDNKDLLNISHSNHSKSWGGVFFVRKDATRSKIKIEEMINRELNSLMYDLDNIKRRQESLHNSLEELETCEDLEKFYF